MKMWFCANPKDIIPIWLFNAVRQEKLWGKDKPKDALASLVY